MSQITTEEIVFIDDVCDDDVVVDAELVPPSGEPCIACGTPVEAVDRFCTGCGNRQPAASSAGAASEDVAASEQDTLEKYFRCESCGSEVATDPEHRSYVCPFCDSTYVIEIPAGHVGRQRPEFAIGFAVTPAAAQEKFRKWIRSNDWFRPADLHLAQVEGKQRGVYLPFWSFSMLARSRWSTSIGEYWYRTETYHTTDSKGRRVTKTRQVRETEWWPLAGRHHRYYSGYLVSGSRGLPQQEAERIKPFQLPALKRYKPYFLAGWLSEEYSVTRDEALDRCQSLFQQREQGNISDFLPGDTHRSLQIESDFSHVNSDLCLLPVYVLAYRYRGELYRYLINGQTGKEAGDKPVSWRRIGTLAGGLMAAVVVLVIIVLTVGAWLN